MRLKYLCSSFSTALTQGELLDEGPYMVYGASGVVGYKTDYACEKPYLGIIKDGAGVGRVSFCEPRSSLLGTMAYIIPNDKADINWLKYVLISLDLGKDVGKTTIPHIYFSEYGNRDVNYVPPDKQQRIAAFLDKECSEIDALISRTKDSIAEYKKLKQAVITQTVTKGIRGKRNLKDSGVDWLGEVPEEWSIVRGKGLFSEVNSRSEDGSEELLTVSQYTGVTPRSQKNVNMFEAESLEGYKICKVGDIAANTMWLWAGAIGVSQYEGVISPSYNIYRQKGNYFNSFYLDFLLRIPTLVQCYESLSTGIRASRLRLYPQQFLGIRFPVPPMEEQEEIIAYLKEKYVAMDELISKKEQFVLELENYKKTLIYEYVTGKKEVSPEQIEVTAVIYPYFPAVLNTKKTRFAQAVLAGRILDKCRVKMGRVKLEKMLYTIEASIGFDFDTEYVRQAAGPLDDSVYDCEGIISRKNKWYTIKQSSYGVSYKPAKDNSKYLKYYEKYFANYDSEIERIINIFMNFDADQAEIIATLFAAWNDFVIDKKQFTDEDLVDEVRNNWHDSKKRFSAERWHAAIKYMREINLVPQGYGKRTVINHEG